MKTSSKFIFTVAFSIFLFNKSFSQPSIEWQNTIGGNFDDILASLQQTTDGGYILGGSSLSGIAGDKTEASSGGYDYWVLKLSSSGQIEWQNSIGGSNGDNLSSIDQTTDGGYILGGYSNSAISGDKTEASLVADYWVVKLDTGGVIEWQNTIVGNSADYLRSIQQTADGGYILGGYSSSGISGDKTEISLGMFDYWVVKLDGSGVIEWQNTIGGNSSDNLNSIQQTADGGYILGGSSESGISGDKTEPSLGSSDYWVVKINGTGAIEWQNTIGGSGSDVLLSIQQTSDGGYILGGSSDSGISGDKTENELGDGDYWVVKLNSSGDIVWQNTIGGSSYDGLSSVQQTSDNGYILGGQSSSGISGDKTENNQSTLYPWTYDYWIVKLNSAGEIEWDNTIGGEDVEYFNGDIQQTSDGGYILGGNSGSDISGDKTEDNLGSEDYWVIKLEAGFGAINNAGNLDEPFLSINPNPSSAQSIIRFTLSHSSHVMLELFDIDGRKLQTIFNDQKQRGDHSLILNVSHYPEGIYFIRLVTDGLSSNLKFVIQ